MAYNPSTKRDVQNELNRFAPNLAHAKLGDTLVDIIAAINQAAGDATSGTTVRQSLAALAVDVAAIRTKLISTLTKLDNDAGVTDTNYTSLGSPAALTYTAPSAAAIQAIKLLGFR